MSDGNVREPDKDAPGTERPWPRVSRLRIAGPVVLIVAALVAAGVAATVSERGGGTATTQTSTGTASSTGGSAVPITYAAAAKAGTTTRYDWGPQCDHRTGRLKMPTIYAPPCVPVPAADASNGGATSGGVSGSTINLVDYQSQPGGLTSAVENAAGTPAQSLATVQAYVNMFNRIFETYGRRVNLIPSFNRSS